MIELSTLRIGEPPLEEFNLFKLDASIPDEHRDAVLRMFLRAAMKEIQEYADKSLLPCELMLTVSGREDNTAVRLYQTVSEILSVTDGQGTALGYTLSGRYIVPDRYTDTVRVIYSTEPRLDDLTALRAVVSMYAVALYEHESPDVLAKIKALAVC